MTVQKAPPRPALITVEEFFALSPDGEKADLIDGVIYVASPDTPRNNRFANFIQFLLDGYVSVHGSGEVFASHVSFVLSEFNAPELCRYPVRPGRGSARSSLAAPPLRRPRPAPAR